MRMCEVIDYKVLGSGILWTVFQKFSVKGELFCLGQIPSVNSRTATQAETY